MSTTVISVCGFSDLRPLGCQITFPRNKFERCFETFRCFFFLINFFFIEQISIETIEIQTLQMLGVGTNNIRL